MKDYYKISEISKLYGIGVDSLRYYERLGLIHPRRDTNGYRLYHLKDIYKLNMIRDLRRLDLSMEQIREYLEGQSVENTLSLLGRELDMVEDRLKEFTQRKELLQQRIQNLQEMASLKTGQLTLKTLPCRCCLQIQEHIVRDEEMDFLMQKLHRTYEKLLPDFGSQTVGAVLSLSHLKQGISNVYDSVFFVLDHPRDSWDFQLPEGTYLSLIYRGSYQQNGSQFTRMTDYCRRQGLVMAGSPFELYLIDNRDTIREEEFLTEIQVLVRPASSPDASTETDRSLPPTFS